MSTDFDPYHRWLGIPPKHQPADHYRLLAIERFEEDPEVIADAAERQTAHVRRYALGPHQDISQRILNELAAAKVCLLQPDKKAEYDRKLREQVAAQEPPVPQVASPSVSPLPPVVAPVGTRSEMPAIGARPPVPLPVVTDRSRRPISVGPSQLPRRPRTQMSPVAVVGLAGGGGILLGLLVVVIWSVFSGRDVDDVARAEASKLLQESAAGLPQEIENSIGMKFKLIPAGEFLMGSPDGDSDADSDEKPQHLVRITKPFYLGVTEVTQEQYERVMGQNPSRFKGDPQRPVEMVSWEDAVAFCRKLSEQEGQAYRLPTEAEWECACRAGSTTKWSFGDDAAGLKDRAWYDENSDRSTHPVAQKEPNAFGLYDMHGNVWEWCADWYAGDYYTASPTDDPRGSESGSDRVLRGGGWVYVASGCRAAYRYWGGPGFRYGILGFRLARAVSLASPAR